MGNNPPLTPAERARRYRQRKAAGETIELRPHGTAAAIRRHQYHHEPLCEPCRLERNRLARQHWHNRQNAQNAK